MTEGYIYIMYNEMFSYYGDNIYKIGKAKDIAKRMNGYTTSYLTPPEIKFTSIECSNACLIESLVFYKLNSNRMRNNREFFQLPIEEIIETIESIISKYNYTELSKEEIIKLESEIKQDHQVKQSIDHNLKKLKLKVKYLKEIENLYNITNFDIFEKDLSVIEFVKLPDDLWSKITKLFRIAKGPPNCWYNFIQLYSQLIKHITCNDIIKAERLYTTKDRHKYRYSVDRTILTNYLDILDYKL